MSSNTGKTPRKSASTGTTAAGFSAEEQAAMKERARELKAAARLDRTAADGESEVLEAIAAMPEPDRGMARRIHALVKAHAPQLVPRTWYGMPAYAKDGKVLCFFQSAAKFKSRYATFGFSDQASLDEGGLWPTAFALARLEAAEEKRLGELLRKATV